MTSAVPGLGELPGPASHIRHIREVLLAGQCCLWLLPDRVVECGDANVLVRSVREGLVGLRTSTWTVSSAEGVIGPLDRGKADRSDRARTVVADGDDAVAEKLLARFEHRQPIGFRTQDMVRDPIARPGHRDVSPLLQRLASSDRPGWEAASDPLDIVTADGVSIVRAWLEPFPEEVAALARRFPSHSRLTAAGSPTTGGRLLVVARASDLPPGLVKDLDGDPATEVRWWWGVVGRVDTAALVAHHSSRDARTPAARLRQAVRAESIVEVAGPDLALAMDLAMGWNGRRSDLASLLNLEGDDGEAMTGAAGSPSATTAVQRPPGSLIDEWARGTVDLWEQEIRQSARSPAELDHRLWSGQLRVLMPVIEEARKRLGAELTAAGVSPEIAALEVGPLRARVLADRTWLTAEQHRRLREMVQARNLLAHVAHLSDTALSDLIRALV